MTIWTQRSGSKLAILQERITTTVNLPVDNSATITLIGGQLPKGLRLNGSILKGTPLEVPRNTVYRFVLRAKLNGATEDRTYSIEVQGADEPVWITKPDLLPIGANGTYYILDSTPVNFKFDVIDRDTSSGQRLRYFIGNNGGELPPGLTVTEDGYLVGVVDPVLALEKIAKSGVYDESNFDRFPYDFSIKSSQGYDSFYYDVTIYDYATPTNVPKKLNRFYQFTVSVSDGDTIAQRTFRIYVVGDDFLRADNTIMQVGTGIFTADNTHIRTPIWLTPGDFGYRRANNYITLFLDVIDPNSLTGVVTYSLESTNDDATPSTLPPGTILDTSNGEITGKVPYQPSVTKEYKFTVKATRLTGNSTERASTTKTFIVKLLGEVNSEITWNTNPDLGDIASNYVSTLSVVAKTTVPNATLIYSLSSGRLPPGLELSYDGEIIGKINSFGSSNKLGLTVFDNFNLKLDGNTTSIDRNYTFTISVRDQFGYSASERTFKIKVADPGDKLYSNIYFKPLLKQSQRIAYSNFVTNPAIFNPEYIYRPNDKEFGLQRDINLLVYSGIETVLAERYVAAMALNATRKKYKIGSLKTAVAKTPGTNDTVYEVVYLEIVDPYEKDGKVQKVIRINNNSKILVNSISATPNNPNYDTISKSAIPVGTRSNNNNTIYIDNEIEILTRSGEVRWSIGYNTLYVELNDSSNIEILYRRSSSTNLANRPVPTNTVRTDSNAVLVSDPNKITKYVSNISNIRTELRTLGRTERNYLPLWMRTPQQDSIQELGYTLAVPLCYCLPGTSETIKAAINFSEYNYRQFELDIDRLLIDSTEGVGEPKYFVFANYEFNL
tara:strand:+ start:14133 stop:16640 length:2508 start_codon:yes stop_codon:yes gene_type:complete